MSIIVASMAMILFVAVCFLGAVALHHAVTRSSQVPGRARRWVIVGAARMFAARRAVRVKAEPAVARMAARLRERGAAAPVGELEKAGQQ